MKVQGTHSLGEDTAVCSSQVGRWRGGLTLHGILHVLGKQVPHHFRTDFTHIQLLGKSDKSHGTMKT